MGTGELNRTVAAILAELFNFDGQIEELCAMSEVEGEFGMDSDKMVKTLQAFIAANSAEDDMAINR